MCNVESVIAKQNLAGCDGGVNFKMTPPKKHENE